MLFLDSIEHGIQLAFDLKITGLALRLPLQQFHLEIAEFS